ncbi:sugar transferase [Idiomarina sp.]|uniref:sugar transferase n=1 Tax=Idiomarina sp. TaxID=1874361 RepID=UPI0025BA6D51|nr:sugar transferase [Idiomarina sp.]
MLKRSFDIITSLIGLLLLAPLILIVACLVKVKLGSPILFIQKRPGKSGVPFEMYKFRTMKELYGVNGEVLPDSERLTSFGKFLRSTSLDELPELWNVLKGEMSLVGPRPLLLEYLPNYSKRQYRRHDVLPGITGWAQINGRNSISWTEKLELDIWYVENQTLWLDIKIILKTIKKVFCREGISSASHVTVEKFKGSKD